MKKELEILNEMTSGSLLHDKLKMLRARIVADNINKGSIGEYWEFLNNEGKIKMLTDLLFKKMVKNDEFLEKFELYGKLYVDIIESISSIDKLKVIPLPIIKFKGNTFAVGQISFNSLQELIDLVNSEEYGNVLLYDIKIDNLIITVDVALIGSKHSIYSE